MKRLFVLNCHNKATLQKIKITVLKTNFIYFMLNII